MDAKLPITYLGGEVFLTFEKTFQHSPAYVVSLLLYDLKVFLNGVKLRLQYLLLYLSGDWGILPNWSCDIMTQSIALFFIWLKNATRLSALKLMFKNIL